MREPALKAGPPPSRDKWCASRTPLSSVIHGTKPQASRDGVRRVGELYKCVHMERDNIDNEHART